MGEVTVEKNDELVMKLLHYFITEQGYNPIVLHGAKNEKGICTFGIDNRCIQSYYFGSCRCTESRKRCRRHNTDQFLC